jgi:hypothetical protein
VIIEEFDKAFLAKAFELLWQEDGELIYSRSILEGTSFEVDFSRLVMVEEINKSLESLNAHLVLVEGRAEETLN